MVNPLNVARPLAQSYGPNRVMFFRSPIPRRDFVSSPGAPALFDDVDVSPWIQAAATFEMNSDFDISHQVAGRPLDLPSIMGIMKQASAGKRTIQALSDKIMLHRMLDNLDVPQLPMLLAIDSRTSRHEIEAQVRSLVDSQSCDVVLKPTHLSSGQGVLILTKCQPDQRENTIQTLLQHVETFMAQRAAPHESLALQMLSPGILAQPKYQSVVGFKTPLELRIVVLWGKVRLGLWWWGRTPGATGEEPQRNAWIIRRPVSRGVLGGDEWEVLHNHQGNNPGFDSALDLFERHMPAMAATAEIIASAVGAPFLRVDFFVGSPEWGVRLNEVAYGCGVDYRSCPRDSKNIVDDAPNIARVLQEGMARCRQVRPPQHFLSFLGVEGRCYPMTVLPLPKWGSSRMPPNALHGEADAKAVENAVPEDLCKTIMPRRGSCLRSRSAPPKTRSRSRPTDGHRSLFADVRQRDGHTKSMHVQPRHCPVLLNTPGRAPVALDAKVLRGRRRIRF